ncbi:MULTISPECIES: YdcF family protein [unclassified Parvimonas]|uniref:YdcF family protein n=1 Tax=unclassified Parvimonas TaxID=1151464 RepID=UPI002B48F4E2|nr:MULTISPECIES: YdcF family protein [unclassified Parvimonas]MEB3025058.1 YdcF family protein [Parvimonas sp. M13]MEB3089134.1 YdcF family protein [Parvimonas sp. M20]
MKKLFKFILFICLCLVVLIQSLIYHSQKNEMDTFENYVLVLGAKANNGNLSKTLINRLDTTVEYLNKYKTAKAILCGGKENNNELSQAEYMQKYLIEKGIAKERLITETSSKNTYENIKFALEKLDKKPSEIMVISSSYHLFRAKFILYRFGILARTVPANTPGGAILSSYIRETFAVVKTFLYDKPTEEDIKNLHSKNK